MALPMLIYYPVTRNLVDGKNSSNRLAIVQESLGRDTEVWGKDQLEKAIEQLESEGNNLSLYVALLRQCRNNKALNQGRRVHKHFLRSKHCRNVFLSNLIIELYGKCGALEDARHAFDRLPERNIFSWTIIIAVHIQHEQVREALQLFRCMQIEGIKPNSFTYTTILGACLCPEYLMEGRVIHASVSESGLLDDLAVCNAIVNMYAKCRSLKDAVTTFENMPQKNVVSWTSMILAYCQEGNERGALQLFRQMQLEPDKYTFSIILSACSCLAEIKAIHAHIIASGLEAEAIVGTVLINAYGKFERLEDAKRVFSKIQRRDMISWGAMLGIYAQHGRDDNALQLFRQIQMEGKKPDIVVLTGMLEACAGSGGLAKGKLLHARICRSHLASDALVGTALINMYGKGGSFSDIGTVYSRIVEPDVVCWTTVITLYEKYNYANEAIHLFKQMELEGLRPDKATFLSALEACANLGCLSEGKLVHANAIKGGVEHDDIVQTSVIKMYSNSGSLEYLSVVFDRVHQPSVLSWTSLISAYAEHGHCMDAIHLFQHMHYEGMNPNEFTFVAIICACSDAGLLDAGCYYFLSISACYGLTPMLDHYHCFTDLLGRSGLEDLAEDLSTLGPMDVELF